MGVSGSAREPKSWTVRVLAPLALIATALVLYLIVSGSLGSVDESDNESGDRDEQTLSSCDDPDAQQAVADGYYVIEEGEAGLGAVADNTCVPVERLTELNPNLDPQAIPPQACVDLVPDGCKALAEG